jgi:hypothetical protein
MACQRCQNGNFFHEDKILKDWFLGKSSGNNWTESQGYKNSPGTQQGGNWQVLGPLFDATLGGGMKDK